MKTIEEQNKDLVMLIKLLVNRVKKYESDSRLAHRAICYLKAYNHIGYFDILRDDAEPITKELN